MPADRQKNRRLSWKPLTGVIRGWHIFSEINIEIWITTWAATSDCTGVWLRFDTPSVFRQFPHGISRKNSRKIFRSAKSLGSFADGKRERARVRCQSANCGGKKTSKIALNEDYQALYLLHGTHENRFYWAVPVSSRQMRGHEPFETSKDDLLCWSVAFGIFRGIHRWRWIWSMDARPR